MPDKLKQRRERLAQAAQGESSAAMGPAGSKLSRKKVSREAKTVFTTQLATLQDAGLPVLRSIRVLEGQMEPGPLKSIVGAISEDVEGGASLSDAMAKYPATFDDLYVNMIKAGEASGSLTTICNRLAEFMEKTERLIRRIKGAMMYPLIVMIVAMLIVTFIMLYIIPKFEEAFTQLSVELPGVTKALMTVSRWAVESWYIVLMIPIAIVAICMFVGRTPKGKRFFDQVKLELPLVGPIIKKSQVSRFARTLGTLSSSGVPLMQALDICGDASGNAVVKEGIEAVQAAVKEGEPMARPMGELALFDDIVVNMVDVGEETGELDRMLMKIAENHDLEVDQRIGTLVAFLEPALIVIMAGIVGFIVIALFLPLLKLQEAISSR